MKTITLYNRETVSASSLCRYPFFQAITLAIKAQKVTVYHRQVRNLLVDQKLSQRKVLNAYIAIQLAMILLSGASLAVKVVDLLRGLVQRGPVCINGHQTGADAQPVRMGKAFGVLENHPIGNRFSLDDLVMAGKIRHSTAIPGQPKEIVFI